MPKIKEDFAEQIRTILQNYNAIVFYNNQELNTNELLSDPQNLGNLEQWSFQKADCSNMLAPKKKIISNIKEIRSYVLEDALDDYVEKKWNDSLNKFLSQIENGYSLRIADEDIKVDIVVIESIISTLLLFMCRNPNFDCQGIFPRIESVLLNLLLEIAKNEEEKKNIIDFVSGHIRGAWLSQIYKALFNNDISFFSQYFNSIRKRCQVTVIRCPVENGSFITSDNPAFPFVSFATQSNYNAIYFPLTPQYLLLIGKGEKDSLDKIDVKTATNKGLKKFNSIIISSAYDSLVSDHKYLGYIL